MHRQIEDRGTFVDADGRDIFLDRTRVHIMWREQLEQNLKQRVAAQIAVGIELFHDPFKRCVLPFKGSNRCLADARHQFGKGRVTGQVNAQHHRVEEKANQRLHLGP